MVHRGQKNEIRSECINRDRDSKIQSISLKQLSILTCPGGVEMVQRWTSIPQIYERILKCACLRTVVPARAAHGRTDGCADSFDLFMFCDVLSIAIVDLLKQTE